MDQRPFETIDPSRFMDFIAPEAERFSLLHTLLAELELPVKTVDISGNRHIFVFPGQGLPARGRDLTVMIAHYDRAEGSPGANDNSTAVFLLAEAAVKLKKEGTEDWLIIFTDKEELRSGDSFRSQGSYGLALGLKDIGLGAADFFIFDACGRGDTLVISSTVDYLLGGASASPAPPHYLGDRAQNLRKRALATADYVLQKKVLLAPVPFSDDAGFLSAGIAAQTITVLPEKEASALAILLRRNPQLADTMVRKELWDRLPRQEMPETWRYLNGPGDSYLRLTPDFFPRITRFAKALCGT